MAAHDPATSITITPTMRQLIENVIDDLLLLLDEIDGDADLVEQPVVRFPSRARCISRWLLECLVRHRAKLCAMDQERRVAGAKELGHLATADGRPERAAGECGGYFRIHARRARCSSTVGRAVE